MSNIFKAKHPTLGEIYFNSLVSRHNQIAYDTIEFIAFALAKKGKMVSYAVLNFWFINIIQAHNHTYQMINNELVEWFLLGKGKLCKYEDINYEEDKRFNKQRNVVRKINGEYRLIPF